jgi:hypothetical protein
MRLVQQFDRQEFPNGYDLVDGVKKHAEYPETFPIPPDVLKRYLGAGHFVKLRILSPRFTDHPDAPEICTCSCCQGEARLPIWDNEQPASLEPEPTLSFSRGYGEDFWVRITERSGEFFKGIVDNTLSETPRHALQKGDTISFHEDNILNFHLSQLMEILHTVDDVDTGEMAECLRSLLQELE